MNRNIRETAFRTIAMEAASVAGLKEYINEDFEKVVELIYTAKGRVIVSGIGKTAIIAQKIVATLNSTGTPAIFMHAADAIHGDLGNVQKDDVVMLISKSGETAEIKLLVPLIKNFGNTLIGMTGSVTSFLAHRSDFILNTTVSEEACPNNLAPTSSTTAQLVMGDTLAICLMEKRGFQSSDFARFHPGGALGKQLYLHVEDLYINNAQPKVTSSQSLKEVIIEMTEKQLGITAVVDMDGMLIGVVTDGDLRRMLNNIGAIHDDAITAAEIMTKKPKTIGPNVLAVKALDEMRKNGITQLIVTQEGKYLGVLHLHDLIREGLL